MCKLGTLYKVRLRKVHFSGDFLGALIFSASPGLWESHKKTFKFNKILDFYKLGAL